MLDWIRGGLIIIGAVALAKLLSSLLIPVSLKLAQPDSAVHISADLNLPNVVAGLVAGIIVGVVARGTQPAFWAAGVALWLLLWSYGPLVTLARFDRHGRAVLAVQAALVAFAVILGFVVAWWIRGDKRRAA